MTLNLTTTCHAGQQQQPALARGGSSQMHTALSC